MAVLQKSLEDMTVFLVDKVDEKGLCYNEHQREYMIPMRCGILTLRQGNVLRAEPYNPHRFFLLANLVLTNSFTVTTSSLTFRNRRGTGHI